MIKKALALVLVTLMLSSAVISVFAEGEALPFTDVKKKAWFYDAVRYVYDGGIMNGTSATKFDPSGEVTRAMFVTMLGRLHGAAESSSTSFTDVSFKRARGMQATWAGQAKTVSSQATRTTPSVPMTA